MSIINYGNYFIYMKSHEGPLKGGGTSPICGYFPIVSLVLYVTTSVMFFKDATVPPQSQLLQ